MTRKKSQPVNQASPFWSATKSAVFVCVGFVAGIFADDFVGFRSDNRAALGVEIKEYEASAVRVNTALEKFAKIASGEQSKTPSDLSDLRNQLLAFQTEARELSYRVPGATDHYQDLEGAVLRILDESEKLGSPLTNKPFVAAVSDFLVHANGLQEAAVQAQRSYLN